MTENVKQYMYILLEGMTYVISPDFRGKATKIITLGPVWHNKQKDFLLLAVYLSFRYIKDAVMQILLTQHSRSRVEKHHFFSRKFLHKKLKNQK